MTYKDAANYMLLTSAERETYLTSFLQRWSEEELNALTLDSYTGVGDKNTFAYWLEFGAGRYLGSNAGGDASKFGIYARRAQAKGNRIFILQDDRYSWKKKYGNTALEAFSAIKSNILTIISAVKKHDLPSIQALDFEFSLKWKLAFIYQDHSQPCVLPIYNLERLQMLMPENPTATHSEAYSALMSKRGEQSALDYGMRLWQQTGETGDKAEEGDESESDGVLPIVTLNNRPALNQILYGPPGTGKTYSTLNRALEILDPDFLNGHPGTDTRSRGALKARFDELVSKGRIDFVTFHQSFSYEDFVEGIRAVANAEQGDGLKYRIEDGVFKLACNKARTRGPQVLIIDEINRGNISRVFGELITLIEPTKRHGESEALELTLPYSKTRFSVPNTLWIIGTMNTADRSLAGLDIALRRRFTFVEMQPDYSLLADVTVEENGVEINISQLLEVINQRIALLLDREHCLGHAYFMPLKANPELSVLASIFRSQIIPLLQEYFFEDWVRINWVLNGHRVENSALQLIRRPLTQMSLKELFGSDLSQEIEFNDRRWELNFSAFLLAESYRNIIGLA